MFGRGCAAHCRLEKYITRHICFYNLKILQTMQTAITVEMGLCSIASREDVPRDIRTLVSAWKPNYTLSLIRLFPCRRKFIFSSTFPTRRVNYNKNNSAEDKTNDTLTSRTIMTTVTVVSQISIDIHRCYNKSLQTSQVWFIQMPVMVRLTL